MAKVPTKVVNWLYSVLQPQYLHKEVAYTHIYQFLAVYLTQGFRIRTAVYTSSDGKSQLVINLHGLLAAGPVSVPLSIWIPLNYPFSEENRGTDANGVPVVYVVPEAGTVIRPGNNVDTQGRFYHPYLAQWHNEYRNGSSSEFSLLLLLNCVRQTFEMGSPIAPESTGPALPPKPGRYSNPISPQLTGLRRETTGPPVPDRPGEIPLKYRNPPPLPNLQQIPVQSTGSLQITTPYYQPHSQPSTTAASPQRTTPQLQQKVAEIEDLMDQVTLDGPMSDDRKSVLERISDQINAFLGSEESANGTLNYINETSTKLTSLHQQLSHHNKQAQANSDNLGNHINYLLGQLEALKTLNNDMGQLDKVNSLTVNEVHTSLAGDKMALDDIVTPDLTLVHQLYDVSSEIKAYKDAIRLVGGNFRSEGELVNDDNLDSCIKAVRGLARDVFWLEVTKAEIAKTMGLH